MGKRKKHSIKRVAINQVHIPKHIAKMLPRKFRQLLLYMRKPWIAALVVLVVAVLVHTLYVGAVARYVTHDGKTFPNVVVAGHDAGSLDGHQLTDRLATLLGGQPIKITYNGDAKTFNAQTLGLSIDERKLEQQLITQRDWSSLLRPWFVSNEYTLPILADEDQLAKALRYFKNPDFKRPTDATFTFLSGEFKVKDDAPGLGFDIQEISGQLKARLGAHLEPLTVEAVKKELQAAVQTQDIRSVEAEIKGFAAKTYQIVSADKTITSSKVDVATWLRVEKKDGKSQVSINEAAVRRYVAKAAASFKVMPATKVIHQFVSGKPNAVVASGRDGKAVANVASLAQGLLENLKQGKAYRGEVSFKQLARKTETKTINDVGTVFTYEIITWGTVKANLNEFATQVAQTLGDSRGWSAAGIQFKRVSSGGDFSVVLSEPARVASAAPICDAYYSCRVGRYVIINDDRWRGATPAWNNAGGSLRNYRHMLVNHETGHWLGYGHRYCPAPGAPAPVMQQQSIGLQGCAFNPWPTRAEIDAY